MPRTKSANPSKAKTPRATKTTTKPTHEEISRRAYELFLERNGAPGDPHSDWLRAEAELFAPSKRGSRKSKVVSIAA